jgi:hypothetical protein
MDVIRRALLLACAVGLVAFPAAASAESLHVVFPQQVETTVVQGQSTDFTMEVQAYGATRCDATTAPVRVNSLYSVDALGDIADGVTADMPIVTDQGRGDSDNCYIHNPVVIPLTATAAAETPVGDYTSVIRYGKGGDGGVDLDGPPLTIHVIAPDQEPELLPPPELAPPEIVPPPPPLRPTLGKTLLISRVKGKVTFHKPGKGTERLTSKPTLVPNGTDIDSTNGVVKVTVVRDAGGELDTADAWEGDFEANQAIGNDGRGLTTFTLAGDATSSRRVASAAKVRRHSHLWVNGKGNFKTRGKRASAIVRGTAWLTEETGNGTKISVSRGLVAVRDFTRNRTVLVPQGRHYTAPNSLPHIRRPVFTGSVRR